MAAKTDKTPRKTQSGAASLRARGLVGLPLSLTRGQRNLIQGAARLAGCASVSEFAVPALERLAAEVVDARSGKNLGKKEGKGIDSSDS